MCPCASDGTMRVWQLFFGRSILQPYPSQTASRQTEAAYAYRSSYALRTELANLKSVDLNACQVFSGKPSGCMIQG